MDCKDSVNYIKQLIKGVFFLFGRNVGYLRVLVLRVFGLMRLVSGEKNLIILSSVLTLFTNFAVSKRTT